MIKVSISITLLFFVIHANAQGHCEHELAANQDQAAIDLSHQAATEIEQTLEDAGVEGSSKKGYAILLGGMVGSAALTTYLGAHLSEEFKFTSIFLSQISTLGVYVLGAPIWEPISSKFRKWAFGLNRNQQNATVASRELESTWIRTQESYSLNAQMSRNIISQFIITVKDNFYQAYRAMTENNPEYAADQVAEAAYRMRILFKEILPTERSVAAAINSAFTSHVEIDAAFRKAVWQKLNALDSDSSEPDVRAYYQVVLHTWLK